jgi:hypothetical protein
MSRLSCLNYDPGFDPYESLWAKVTINGVEAKSIQTADEELGLAWGYALARDTGSVIVACSEQHDGRAQYCDKCQTWEVCYTGEVKIEWGNQRERAYHEKRG